MCVCRRVTSETQPCGMCCKQIQTLSFSFSPSVTSVELSIWVFITPNNTRSPPSSLHLTARTPQRTHTHCCRVYTHTHAGVYYRRDVLDSSCQWAGSLVFMELADVCICIHHRETRRWAIDGVCVRSRTSGSPLSRSHRSFSVESPNRRLFIYRNRWFNSVRVVLPEQLISLRSQTGLYIIYTSL